MFPKYTPVFCMHLFFVQTVFSQPLTCKQFATDVLGAAVYDGPVAYESLADWVVSGIYPNTLSTAKFSPTFGGVFVVKCKTAGLPAGISVVSNNAFEGVVNVVGELPFIGTSTIAGLMPSLGTGGINHSCGNGFNGLTALSLVSTPGSHETSEYAIPYRTPGLEPILCEPFLPASTFVAPMLPASAVSTDFEAPYTMVALEPILTEPVLSVPSYDTPILPELGISVPHNLPVLEPVLTSPSCVASVLPAQSYVGTPYISSCEKAFTTIPCDIECTITDSGNLPVTSASVFSPMDISISSATADGGSLLIAGELPLISSVGIEGVLPRAGAGDIIHVCSNGGYVGDTYTPGYSLSPIANHVPENSYYYDSIIRDYRCDR